MQIAPLYIQTIIFKTWCERLKKKFIILSGTDKKSMNDDDEKDYYYNLAPVKFLIGHFKSFMVVNVLVTVSYHVIPTLKGPFVIILSMLECSWCGNRTKISLTSCIQQTKRMTFDLSFIFSMMKKYSTFKMRSVQMGL